MTTRKNKEKGQTRTRQMLTRKRDAARGRAQEGIMWVLKKRGVAQDQHVVKC